MTAVGHASSVTYVDLATWGMGVLILMGLSKGWGWVEASGHLHTATARAIIGTDAIRNRRRNYRHRNHCDQQMPKHQKPGPRFAICIHSDDPDLLTPRMIYEVLPDESAAKSKYIRVVDNEGEDYLYPADYFVFVDFPQAIEQALRRVAPPVSKAVPAT